MRNETSPAIETNSALFHEMALPPLSVIAAESDYQPIKSTQRLTGFGRTLAIGAASLGALIGATRGQASAATPLAQDNPTLSPHAGSLLSGTAVSPLGAQALPLPLSPAQVFCIDPKTGLELRIIHLYRESPTYSAMQDKAAKRHHVYYHAPFGGWVERAEPHQELPSIIHAESGPDKNGICTFLLKFSTTSPELREVCRNAVLKNDKQYAIQGGVAEADVLVNYYPVTQAEVRCFHPMINQELAVYRTEILTSAAEMEIYLPIRREQRAIFLDAIRTDQLRFNISIQGNSDRISAANIEISCAKEISQAVTGNFSSEQQAGTAPIFQDQATKVVQTARELISRSIRETRPGLAAEIDSSMLLAKVFDSTQDYSMDELMSEFDGAADKFNAFIRPHLETFSKEMAKQGVEISIEEHHSGETRGGGRGGSFLGFGAKKSWSTMKEDLSRLERITGSSFREAEGGTRFAPHKIKVTKLKEGWSNVRITSQDTVFSTDGPQYQFVSDSAFKPSWTVAFSRASLGLARTHFNGVQNVIDENTKQKAEIEKFKADALADKKAQEELAAKTKNEIDSRDALLDAERKKVEELVKNVGDREKQWAEILAVLNSKPQVFPNAEARYEALQATKDYFIKLGVDAERADRYAYISDLKNAVSTPLAQETSK